MVKNIPEIVNLIQIGSIISFERNLYTKPVNGNRIAMYKSANL
jgi:hypothetical protein